MNATIHQGDCLHILRAMPDASVDAIVTDPPYGLANASPTRVIEAVTAWATGDRERVPDGRGFMGHQWDAFVPPPAVWDECLRVLKPGGHLVAFAGSRTHDLMGLSIRMAGFEIRDSLAWVHAQGFPKSLDVSKSIDKAAGAEREVVGRASGAGNGSVVGLGSGRSMSSIYDVTAAHTDDARRWEGWGTALKPAHEPVTLARKPLDGTVAANVLQHGTGALNINACRIGDEVRVAAFTSLAPAHGNKLGAPGTAEARRGTQGEPKTYTGRWPANVVLDEHQAHALDQQSGVSRAVSASPAAPQLARGWGMTKTGAEYDDGGGASRFFFVAADDGPRFRYCAKASSSERPDVDGVRHATVKPLTLMRWLVRLVTPPGGVVLDPFAGSGTTLEAAMLEGFEAVGIERDPAYVPLVEHRIARATHARQVTQDVEPDLFTYEEGTA